MKTPPTRHIPASYSLVVRAKSANAVVYMMDGNRFCAMGFQGNAAKPSFHYNFRTEESRAKHVANFFASVKATEDHRAKRQAEKKAFRHTLKAGDVLYTSWGYDQTNIEFFQVVKLVGDCMVIVREIAHQSEETGWLQGKCVPAVGHFIGKELRKRVLQGNTLDIHHASFGRASLYEMQEVAPGVKIGPALHWSSYA